MVVVPGNGVDVNVTYNSYPYSDEWEFEAGSERINLDEECKCDLESGNGFIISSPKAAIKKDIKDPNGIFSDRFGPKLGDLNPFMDRYSCECGRLRHRINHGMLCSHCNTRCKYVGDNFHMFGWIKLNRYHFIHPDMYKSLEYLFGQSKQDAENRKQKGTKLKNMLYYAASISQSGHIIGVLDKPVDEPFYGIGMIEFYNRFDEILDYYGKKNPKKLAYYEDIVADRDKVFAQSFPVFTTHLRPTDIQDKNMFFEPMNASYNIINIHMHRVNLEKTKMQRDIKMKNLYLYKMQMKMMKLYDQILDVCRGKKGQFRTLVSGRYNFSSRAVIVQDPSLRIDQIKLPYASLVIMLQMQIVNIIRRLYNLNMADASQIVQDAITTFDPRVGEIIDTIIKNTHPEGLPVMLNRNPTINYGSIMQMFCIGYTRDLAIRVPLQCLKPFAADFDGDSLNVFRIINQKFFERAYQIFNPRNAMYISRNDGFLNPDVMVQRDTIINANTLLHLGRSNYTADQMAVINQIKEEQKRFFGD